MTQNNTVRIAAICGSLRKASTNMMLLKIAQEVAPSNAVFEFIDFHDIPMMNEDLEKEVPKSVLRMKDAVGKCDAILFAVPEYNFGIAAPLKNMVDWCSRPMYGGGNVFNEKPCAMISAAGGAAGGHRAQLQLRSCCHYLNTPLVNQPMVCVPACYQAFTPEGQLKEEKHRESVVGIVKELVDMTLALRQFKAQH